MALCKYCNQDKKLIKAHILPRKFYTGYEKTGYGALTSSGYTRKKFQSGLYDENILCTECDNHILGKFDNEAYKLLLNIETKKQKVLWKGIDAYIYNEKEFDFDNIRKFFIALLWKASISKLEYMKIVELGPYENIAYKLLKDEIKNDNYFKVIITKSKNNDLKGVHSIYPYKNVLGRNYVYAIYFDSYIALIFIKYIGLPSNLQLLSELFISRKNIIIVEGNIVDSIKLNYFSNFSNYIKK